MFPKPFGYRIIEIQKLFHEILSIAMARIASHLHDWFPYEKNKWLWWITISALTLLQIAIVYLLFSGCAYQTGGRRGGGIYFVNNPQLSFVTCLKQSPTSIMSNAVPLYQWNDRTSRTYLQLGIGILWILAPALVLMPGRKNRQKLKP